MVCPPGETFALTDSCAFGLRAKQGATEYRLYANANQDRYVCLKDSARVGPQQSLAFKNKRRFACIMISHLAAKGVRQKEFGKKVTEK